MSLNQAGKFAAGLTRYKKPMPVPVNRDISEQLDEYLGTGSFHCPEHQKLAEKLQVTTKAYSQTRSLLEKQQIASAEMQLWFDYVKSRLEVLPTDFKITEQSQARLQRQFSKKLFRREDTIAAERMLDFHTSFIEEYPFEVPLDKKSLHEMIHPHGYYLCSMPVGLTFAQLLQFYSLQILASYERSLGEDLLARQLSALNYWRFIDLNQTGILYKAGFQDILQTLKFPKLETIGAIKTEFEWTLNELPGEFDGMNDEEFFVRFQLIRKLFLDHNL